MSDELVKGGQGREAPDVEDAAKVVALTSILALLLFIGAICVCCSGCASTERGRMEEKLRDLNTF